MFDDLRNSGNDELSSFFKDDQAEIEPLLEEKPAKRNLPKIKFNSNNFLGMNAFQRFFISILLFLVVCILGTMFLLITESIVF